MNPESPASSPGEYPSKRARHTPPSGNGSGNGGTTTSPLSPGDATLEGGGAGRAGQSSGFRNVSACNRCRLRKNRCDQRLPGCASCEKAGVKCVGNDPITKREIPRSYVFYLETRVSYLEDLLHANAIPFAPAEVLEIGSRPGPDPNAAKSPTEEGSMSHNGADAAASTIPRIHKQKDEAREKKRRESQKLDNLMSDVSMVSVQGASDPRYLGSTSGISFARVVFAAVKSSVSTSNSEKGSVRPSKPISAKAVGSGGTSMRDSFFGLHTKPTIKEAPFPDRKLGLRLVTFYFEHANPQVPILHRGEFMKMFNEVYADKDRVKTPKELYMLNIVFAIGGGIFLGDAGDGAKADKRSNVKKKGSSQQCQPEEYHASAIVHLEACLSLPSVSDRPDGFGGGLEELQAVLLLAGFALLRPVAPGLWYIIGVAVRLAVDLGLHYEDGKDIDIGLEEDDGQISETDSDRVRRESLAKERGRRQWVRDFRRRLWWCTYSFDRLVSTCVGRPFGITDQVVTTEFPSLLDDKYITPTGFIEPEPGAVSYKHVAYHYFRLRLLQSEILQVLQFQQSQQVRAGGANQRNPYMHTQLPSPFLSRFDSFRSWRIDIDRRLWHWKESAPTKQDTGVQFTPEFLELNYWQAIIMLYRQSLSTPAMFEGEFNTSDEVESPSAHTVELREDEERVFLKVAEAGQRVLRLYRQLHRVHLVNYTFLATHHLFMAGISFLYAIWHSPIVRSRLTMDEVDFTILAAISVLGDLIEKCPPAEACRDAFNRMSKATVQMCLSTTGFSSSAQGLSSRSQRSQNRADEQLSNDYFPSASTTQFATSNARSNMPSSRTQRLSDEQQQQQNRQQQSNLSRPAPQFDMGLNDLFPSPQSQPDPQQESFRPSHPSHNNSNNNGTRPTAIKREYNASEAFGIPASQIHSPTDYALSPPQTQARPQSSNTTPIDPSLLPPQMSPPPSIANYAAAGPPPPSQALDNSKWNFNDLDFPLQDMDFLQNSGLSLGLADQGLGNAAGGGGSGTTGGGGMELGFGLGWEGIDHDFSEGNQRDLFEGFFFGNSGAY